MFKTVFILIMVLVLLMAAVAGCNGKDVEDSYTDTPESSKSQTSPTPQTDLLKDYQLISTHEEPGPEDSTLLISGYIATVGSTADKAIEDFNHWAEKEGWSLLEKAEYEHFYKKGDEVMQLMGDCK